MYIYEELIQKTFGKRVGFSICVDEPFKGADAIRYRLVPVLIKKHTDAEQLARIQAIRAYAEEHNIDILEVSDQEIIEAIYKIRGLAPSGQYFCGKCFEHIHEEHKYCPYCGTLIVRNAQEPKT